MTGGKRTEGDWVLTAADAEIERVSCARVKPAGGRIQWQRAGRENFCFMIMSMNDGCAYSHHFQVIIILYSFNSVYHPAQRFITGDIRSLALSLFIHWILCLQTLLSILPPYRTSIQPLNAGPHQTSTRYWITLQVPTVFFLSLPPGITCRMFSS